MSTDERETLDSIRDELIKADQRLTSVGIRIPEVQSAIRCLYDLLKKS